MRLLQAAPPSQVSTVYPQVRRRPLASKIVLRHPSHELTESVHFISPVLVKSNSLASNRTAAWNRAVRSNPQQIKWVTVQYDGQ